MGACVFECECVRVCAFGSVAGQRCHTTEEERGSKSFMEKRWV